MISSSENIGIGQQLSLDTGISIDIKEGKKDFIVSLQFSLTFLDSEIMHRTLSVLL
jgi:hypothetical protein